MVSITGPSISIALGIQNIILIPKNHNRIRIKRSFYLVCAVIQQPSRSWEIRSLVLNAKRFVDHSFPNTIKIICTKEVLLVRTLFIHIFKHVFHCPEQLLLIVIMRCRQLFCKDINGFLYCWVRARLFWLKRNIEPSEFIKSFIDTKLVYLRNLLICVWRNRAYCHICKDKGAILLN